ncbi:MAG: M20 family metallopeptidase [Planctomycetales bacterium]
MNALDLTQQLVRYESTSCLSNAAVSDHIESVLKQLDFEVERVEYDAPAGVRKVNLVARKGSGLGGLAYFCHSDTVPADTWKFKEHGPYTPTLVQDRLYGRGSCDMKGSLSCMLAAAGRVSASDLKQPLYFTCTADEEVGYGGALEVAKRSQLFREMVAHQSKAIIGEPTELEVVYAHKGTYGFKATSRGKAAHSSTNFGLNANLAMIPFLAEMKSIHDELQSDPKWQDPEFDPPTLNWNIGINDHTRAVNITAPQSVCTVYFRPMPGTDSEALLERARKAAEKCGLEFEVNVKGPAVYVDPKSEFVQQTLKLAGKEKLHTVAYGTDGVMFTELKNMVILGPGSILQAHTYDEFIALDQLEKGTSLYHAMIREICS